MENMDDIAYSIAVYTMDITLKEQNIPEVKEAQNEEKEKEEKEGDEDVKKEELKMIEQGEEMKERWEVDFMKAEEEEVYEEKG